jgi:hypothetical protein
MSFCSSVVPTENLCRDPGGSSSRLGQTSDNSPPKGARLRRCVCRSVRFLCGLLFIFVLASKISMAAEPVHAEIGKTVAWTGDRVPLIITLYSPGPFSGTASFDLPEISGTMFVKVGNPVVGSEQVDDDSYLTQRHEFAIYTQRAGEIVIPAFEVRFSGKPTFTSDAQPVKGVTTELRFESKRPPGAESMGVIVSATKMNIQQSWKPQSIEEITSGDVVERTIERKVEGTTAMMLPAFTASAQEGVRVYTGAPEVVDNVERGESSARRIDRVKYLFERGGAFTLPEVTFDWWDPQQEKLQSKTLPGLTVEVVESNSAAQQQEETSSAGQSSISRFATFGLLALGILAWFLRKPASHWLQVWQVRRHRPEAMAAKRLKAACRSNDATAAYQALTNWLRSQGAGSSDGDSVDTLMTQEGYRSLREQWQELSRYLFASESQATAWNGSQLWTAFSRTQNARSQSPRHKRLSSLPALNPAADFPADSAVT